MWLADTFLASFLGRLPRFHTSKQMVPLFWATSVLVPSGAALAPIADAVYTHL